MTDCKNIGEICSYSCCIEVDYLPMQCSSCKKIFCRDHVDYDLHGCAKPGRKPVVNTMTEKQKETCCIRKCKEKILFITCRTCDKKMCVKHRHIHKCL